MVTSWRSLFFLFLCLFFWVATATAASVQAIADRDRVAPGESLQLQLLVDGRAAGDPDLSALEENWEILSRSKSSQWMHTNNGSSRSMLYRLTLMPRLQGTVTIPAICVAQDCSLPLPIEVSATAAQAGADNGLILETEVSAQKIVAEAQLLLSVRLLFSVNLTDGQLTEPKPTGVTARVQKLGDDRSYETRRNGQRYQVIERNYAIFPQTSGQMRIPPLQLDGQIANSQSRFDLLGRQGQRVRRTSEPLEIEVTPLPEDLGQRPWIPATSIDLQDDWQLHHPQLVVGEPATRTLKLQAGGVPAAQLPELTFKGPDSFKLYPDQPQHKDSLSSSGITGILEQKIAIVPTQAGDFTLPAIDLNWWDLNTGQWKLAHLDELKLRVAAAPAGTLSSPATPLPVPEPQRQDSASDSLSAPPAASALLADNKHPAAFWPWLSLALALGWGLTLFFLCRRRGTQKTVESPTVQSSEKMARKAVVQAARRQDPQSTRQALLDWSRALSPQDPAAAYERLQHAAEPELAEQIAALDSCLYGRSTLVWNGDQLAKLVASSQVAHQNQEKPKLPDLYPEL
jgi:hypothetical protein